MLPLQTGQQSEQLREERPEKWPCRVLASGKTCLPPGPLKMWPAAVLGLLMQDSRTRLTAASPSLHRTTKWMCLLLPRAAAGQLL